MPCISLANHYNYSLPHAVSSVTASIDVASGRRTFRVRCTSSGGKAVSMSVTGPGGFSEDLDNILAVGTPQRRGNDSFSDSTDIIKLSGESDGQVYECTASNGVSSDPTASVELRGDLCIHIHNMLCSCLLPTSSAVANPPTITLQQLSLTSVRVTWSQPPGGATVMRYIVHYSDGDTHTNKTVSSSSTSYDITGLTVGATYTFSVEATSQHLSGESEMTITLRMFIINELVLFQDPCPEPCNIISTRVCLCLSVYSVTYDQELVDTLYIW